MEAVGQLHVFDRVPNRHHFRLPHFYAITAESTESGRLKNVLYKHSCLYFIFLLGGKKSLVIFKFFVTSKSKRSFLNYNCRGYNSNVICNFLYFYF